MGAYRKLDEEGTSSFQEEMGLDLYLKGNSGCRKSAALERTARGMQWVMAQGDGGEDGSSWKRVQVCASEACSETGTVRFPVHCPCHFDGPAQSPNVHNLSLTPAPSSLTVFACSDLHADKPMVTLPSGQKTRMGWYCPAIWCDCLEESSQAVT